MRRADRLFRLVQLIRGRRLSTARFLAERLEVSERTVYRDVADLMAQGVPIEGEAGVGYRMQAGFDLPPLMFTREEAQSLVAAVRIARSRLDEALAGHAETALSKILAVLPAAVARRGRKPDGVRAADGARCGDARAPAPAARGHRAAAQGAPRLPRPEGRGERAHRAAARLRLLGRGLDAGRVVRNPRRPAQLPRRPDRRAGRAGRALSRRAGQDHGRPAAPGRVRAARRRR